MVPTTVSEVVREADFATPSPVVHRAPAFEVSGNTAYKLSRSSSLEVRGRSVDHRLRGAAPAHGGAFRRDLPWLRPGVGLLAGASPMDLPVAFAFARNQRIVRFKLMLTPDLSRTLG